MPKMVDRFAIMVDKQNSDKMSPRRHKNEYTKQYFEQQTKLEQVSSQARLSIGELVSKFKTLSKEETTFRIRV